MPMRSGTRTRMGWNGHQTRRRRAREPEADGHLRQLHSHLERCFEDAAQFKVRELHGVTLHAAGTLGERDEPAAIGAGQACHPQGRDLHRVAKPAHPGDSVPGVCLAVAGQGPGDLDVPLYDGRVAPFLERANVGLHDEREEPAQIAPWAWPVVPPTTLANP